MIKRKANTPITKNTVWTTISIPAEVKKAFNKICVLREISATGTAQVLIEDWLARQIELWESENPTSTTFHDYKVSKEKS